MDVEGLSLGNCLCTTDCTGRARRLLGLAVRTHANPTLAILPLGGGEPRTGPGSLTDPLHKTSYLNSHRETWKIKAREKRAVVLKEIGLSWEAESRAKTDTLK